MLNRYEKLGVIGEGPRSTVFRCSVEGLSQERAIKELHRQWLNDRHERDMFFREAESWGGLKNNHLITIHDVVFEQGWQILELLRPASASFDRYDVAKSIQRFLREALEGLEEIHSAGYLHANLKPTNVLVNQKGAIVIADGRCVPFSQTQQLPAHRGSAKFLTPEMCESRFEQVGPNSDLYSLGFVLLDLVVGNELNAFAMKSQLNEQISDEQDFETAWWRWHGSRSEKLDPVHKIRPDLPRWLADIIDRLTCKDVSQRFASAADVLTELAERQSDVATTGSTGAVLSASKPVDSAKAPTRVVDRPDSPTILRFASGPKAGDMLGSSESEFSVGVDGNHQIQLGESDYPQMSGTSLHFRREVQGWTVACQGRDGFWVNQSRIQSECPIRSGDLIRMSPSGPDFQFIVHNVGLPSLSDIAAKYAPKLLNAVKPASAPAAPGAAPLPPSALAASSPPAQASVAPVAPAPPSRPSPPVDARPPAPPSQDAMTEKQPGMFGKLFAKKPLSSDPGEKSNQNLYITIISVAAIAAAVIAWPVDRPKKPQVPEENAVEKIETVGELSPAVETAATPVEAPVEPAKPTVDSGTMPMDEIESSAS